MRITRSNNTDDGRVTPALAELGRRSRHGNLLGIQPWLTPRDYQTPRTLYARLDELFRLARRLGWLHPRTVAVLPEYLGTWLLAAGAPQAVLDAAGSGRAMALLIAARLPAFARALAAARGSDRLRDALFRMSAATMASAFHDALAALAREYAVTLVGGTIVLPAPQVVAGVPSVSRGPLRNVAFVYRPDGRLDDRLVSKVYPIREEAGFVAGLAPSELPVFETPAGKLGVAVCADAWYPQVYAALRAAGAELLAVPSYLAPAGVWSRPWQGYNGGPAPQDVAAGDIGQISEGQAWLRYAMAARAPAHGFHAGINVFLRGELWDLGADGLTTGVRGSETALAPERDGAALVNVWL